MDLVILIRSEYDSANAANLSLPKLKAMGREHLDRVLGTSSANDATPRMTIHFLCITRFS